MTGFHLFTYYMAIIVGRSEFYICLLLQKLLLSNSSSLKHGDIFHGNIVEQQCHYIYIKYDTYDNINNGLFKICDKFKCPYEIRLFLSPKSFVLQSKSNIKV